MKNQLNIFSLLVKPLIVLAIFAGFAVGMANPSVLSSPTIASNGTKEVAPAPSDGDTPNGMGQTSRPLGDHAIWMAVASIGSGSSVDTRSWPRVSHGLVKSLCQVEFHQRHAIASAYQISPRLGRRFTLVGAKPSGTG